MHLEMRILLERLDRHECATLTERETSLRATVVARAPALGDDGREVLFRLPTTKRAAQIDATRRVEAEVPHPVGGQAAAIATPAERIGRGRNDPEDRSVGEREAIGRRRRMFDDRFDRAVVL